MQQIIHFKFEKLSKSEEKIVYKIECVIIYI